MSITAIVSSDWHGDWVSHGIRRFREIDRAVEKTVDAVSRKSAGGSRGEGVYCMLGDLANPDNGPATIRAIGLAVRVASFLSTAHIHSFWVSGNHDVFEDSSGESTLSPIERIGGPFVHVFQRPGVACIDTREGPCTVIGLPYPAATAPYDPSELDLEKMLDAAGYALGGPIMVLGHLTNIPGVPKGEESSEMARGRDVTFPVESVGALRKLMSRAELHVFNGHFHRRTTVTFPNFTLEIPGALARLTFGEERHTPSFLAADIGYGSTTHR